MHGRHGRRGRCCQSPVAVQLVASLLPCRDSRNRASRWAGQCPNAATSWNANRETRPVTSERHVFVRSTRPDHLWPPTLPLRLPGGGDHRGSGACHATGACSTVPGVTIWRRHIRRIGGVVVPGQIGWPGCTGIRTGCAGGPDVFENAKTVYATRSTRRRCRASRTPARTMPTAATGDGPGTDGALREHLDVAGRSRHRCPNVGNGA